MYGRLTNMCQVMCPAQLLFHWALFQPTWIHFVQIKTFLSFATLAVEACVLANFCMIKALPMLSTLLVVRLAGSLSETR